MNPYERYYMRKKIITGVIAAGIAVAIGGAVLLIQPWNIDTPPAGLNEDNSGNGGDEIIQPPVEKTEPDLSITVAGKKVDCFLYQGDGWTIPYPVDWAVVETDGAVHFIPQGSNMNGTCLSVAVTDKAAYDGSFIATGAKAFGGGDVGRERLFYYGASRGYGVSGKMTGADIEEYERRLAEGSERNEYEKTMTAMARTMTVGSERPFASLYPMASEPDWQVVDGEVILFLDKDGVDIEAVAETAVKKRMSGWSSDVKENFTGDYRLGTPEWDSSYTCVVDNYVDVFCMRVSYKIAAGKADAIELKEGQRIENGWLIDDNALLYVAVFHDGSVVTNRISAWGDGDYFGAKFAAEVLK